MPADRFRVSLRLSIAVLVLVALIPSVIIALVELSRLNADRMAALEREGIRLADEAGAKIESIFAERAAVLRVLAQSTALKKGDLAAFHERARNVLGPPEGTIVLLDRSPRMLLSTAVPFGSALPPTPETTVTRRAIETGAVEITNLVFSPFTGEPAMSLVLAPRDSEYVIWATIRSAWLDTTLNLPDSDEWYIGVTDRNGVIAARNRDPEAWVGKRMTDGAWALVQQASVGRAPMRTVDGVAVYTSWKRLSSGWFVLAGIDRTSADRIVSAETRGVGFALGLASLAAIVLALLASTMLTRRLKGLADSVIAFGQGDDVSPPRSAIREIDDAADALTAAVRSRRQAEAMLRANEARLKVVIETAADAILVIDAKGVIRSVNPAACKLFGYADDEMTGRNVSMLMREPDRSAHDDYLRTFRDTGVRKIIGIGREVVARRKDDSEFPADLAVAEWRLDDAQFFTGIMRDISERRSREDHVRFLLGEVNHRSKNLLAVVQSVARQTAGSNTDFAAKFGGRLQALSANQDMLVSNQWRAVEIHALVASQLDQFGDFTGDRVTIVGPPLDLTANSTQAISMALHELATNAIKYGALSNASGRVDIKWDVDVGEFRMSWSESGGPPVVPPHRNGFGATVFEHMLARSVDGVAKMTFAESGIVWSLRCPRANVVANAPAAS
jgi:PAS domain S-box-containing protein